MMPNFFCTANGKNYCTFVKEHFDELKKLKENNQIVKCFDCGDENIILTSEHDRINCACVRAHFKHRTASICKGESEYHQYWKALLFAELRKYDIYCGLEYKPSPERRADLFIKHNGNEYVIEIEYSNKGQENYNERVDYYQKNGIKQIWIIHNSIKNFISGRHQNTINANLEDYSIGNQWRIFSFTSCKILAYDYFYARAEENILTNLLHSEITELKHKIFKAEEAISKRDKKIEEYLFQVNNYESNRNHYENMHERKKRYYEKQILKNLDSQICFCDGCLDKLRKIFKYEFGLNLQLSRLRMEKQRTK